MIFRDQIIGHAEFMPNGKTFFITEGVGWTIQSKIDFYDTLTKKLKNSATLSGPVKSINFSKDGSLLYTASGERTVTVWDTVDGSLWPKTRRFKRGLHQEKWRGDMDGLQKIKRRT